MYNNYNSNSYSDRLITINFTINNLYDVLKHRSFSLKRLN